VAAGPAVAYGLALLPQQWRRTTEWLLIGGAVSMAVLADWLTDGPGGGGVFVYVLAVLPGLIAFLAWRTLLASTFVSLADILHFSNTRGQSVLRAATGSIRVARRAGT
jgi:hypothetical protein